MTMMILSGDVVSVRNQNIPLCAMNDMYECIGFVFPPELSLVIATCNLHEHRISFIVSCEGKHGWCMIRNLVKVDMHLGAPLVPKDLKSDP